MSKLLVTQAVLTRFQTMADGGYRLIFDTPELSPDTVKTVGESNRKQGVLVFKTEVEKISEEEIEEIKKFDVKGLHDKETKRSKSQILRAFLYRAWENKKDPDAIEFEKFEDYYDFTMNKAINYYKNLLKDD